MEIGGYTRNMLKIDLSSGGIKTDRLSMDLIKNFIGGYGTCTRLAYDLIKPGIDPLSPDNPIIISAGPLVGTPALSTSKTMAMYKYALNGVISHGSGGGEFGVRLKWAGFDHVIITGASEKPVYIDVYNDGAEIRDASHIWGKDTFEATGILWNEYEDSSVLTYGSAGEKEVRTTTAFIDKCTTMGKGGLPAIMGSKKLKAIVTRGTKGVKVVDPERLIEIALPIIEHCKNQANYDKIIELGTMAGFEGWFAVQGASTKNWTDTLPVDEAYRLYGPDVYLKNFKYERIADPGCLAGCKDHVKIREGEFAGLEAWGSSLYGRLENFAARCQVGSFNRFVKCLEFCNRTSACIHNLTALIDWAIDLYKRGVITKEDTDGLELDWNYVTTMALLEKVVCNEGFGAILGKGFYGAIKAIGRGCEKYAIHVKGMEPLYDARVNRLSTVEFYEVIGPRGAHPSPGGASTAYMTRDTPTSVYRKWAESWAIPEDALKRIFNPPSQWKVQRLVVWADVKSAVENSLGIGCIRSRAVSSYDAAPGGGMNAYVEIYKAITGLDATASGFLAAGHRICDLLKLLNMREGFTRKDDKFPDRWFEPTKRHGKDVWLEDYFGNRLTHEDCEKMLDEYYDERGWDIPLGIPTRQKLIENGLEDIASDLEKHGYKIP